MKHVFGQGTFRAVVRGLFNLMISGQLALMLTGHGWGGLSLLQVGAHYPRGKDRQSRTSLGIWRRPDKMMEEMVGG